MRALHSAATVTAASATPVNPHNAIVAVASTAIRRPVWGDITGLSLRESLLNLRATAPVSTIASTDAGTTITLQNREDISKVTHATQPQEVTTICLQNASDDALSELLTHLEAHPHQQLTLQLHVGGRIKQITALRLSDLSLKALYIGYRDSHVDNSLLIALSRSTFPIALRGNLTPHALLAASRLPTLTSLSLSGRGFDDQVARIFSGNTSLESVSLEVNWKLSAEGVGVIAGIPTLRALSIDDISPHWVNVEVARTLAANRHFESLDIRSKGPILPAENFIALAESGTLKRLRIPSAPSMPYLKNLAHLEHLEFHNESFRGMITLDTPTAAIVAGLPKLRSLQLPSMYFQRGALAKLLSEVHTEHVTFGGYHWFREGDIVALLSNPNVKSLTIKEGYLPANDIGALLNHPTLDHLRINNLEFVRCPGDKRLTLQEDKPARPQADIAVLRSHL